tara:strand:+ start:834 stop:1040 length:207 start_codon:yes stop_codon:yes gene_type:complete
MKTGVIKWFNAKKGYGFIIPDDGGKDIFFHTSALEAAGIRIVNENQKISYDENKHKGRLSAGNLKITE